MLTLGAATEIAGSLAFPSKMPSTSYDIPAGACKAGSKLAKVEGTACSICYAMKDKYTWPNPRKAQEKRLSGIEHPQWVEAMVTILTNAHKGPIRVDLGKVAPNTERYRFNEPGWHRWHSAGDIQSVGHLAKICEIARQTPKIKHWLPTTELGMVRRYVTDGGSIPSNLVIRVSSIMVDDYRRRAWPNTSAVIALREPSDGAFECVAPKQGNECRSCRACWDANVAHMEYHIH